jgi:HEAT repeat protein
LARLLKLLADEEPGVREGAVAGLSDLAVQLDDEQKKQLATRFVGLITDAHPEVGLAAGAALIRLGGASLGPLQGKLADPAVRTHVLEILAGIGPAAKPALDDIIKELDDADPDHAGEAAVAIGAIGPAAAAAVPRLRRVVADTGKPLGLRYAAAYALGRLGPAAKESEPELRKLAETTR